MTFDTDLYFTDPPPDPSPRLRMWARKIRDGWKPNRRLRTLGYSGRADWYGVYVWEQIHVLDLILNGKWIPNDSPNRAAQNARNDAVAIRFLKELGWESLVTPEPTDNPHL